MPGPAAVGIGIGVALYRAYKAIRALKKAKDFADKARKLKELEEKARKLKELEEKARKAEKARKLAEQMRKGKSGASQGCKPRGTKHAQNRHVDRKKYPDKSKYKKPQQREKLRQRTVEKPDRVENQGDRIKYEKDFGREIGTKGERTNVVVVDQKTGKVVTEFPTLGK